MTIDSTGATISKIASQVLGIETLHTRDSDSLDFHDMPVWNIKEALLLAYNAGRDSLIPDFTVALNQLLDYSSNEFSMAGDDLFVTRSFHIYDKLNSLSEKITLASIKEDLI